MDGRRAVDAGADGGDVYPRAQSVGVFIMQNDGRARVDACGTGGGRYDMATEALTGKLGARLNPGAPPEMRPRMRLQRVEGVKP